MYLKEEVKVDYVKMETITDRVELPRRRTCCRNPRATPTTSAGTRQELGKVTEVVGIYILVDDPAVEINQIQPAKCYRLVDNQGTSDGDKKVVEPVPCVTPDRMSQYLDLHMSDTDQYPIVQIVVNEHTHIQNTYFDEVYGAGKCFWRSTRR